MTETDKIIRQNLIASMQVLPQPCARCGSYTGKEAVSGGYCASCYDFQSNPSSQVLSDEMGR